MIYISMKNIYEYNVEIIRASKLSRNGRKIFTEKNEAGVKKTLLNLI